MTPNSQSADLARMVIAELHREADHARQARLTRATRRDAQRQTHQSVVVRLQQAYNLTVTVLLTVLLLSGAVGMLLVETAGRFRS